MSDRNNELRIMKLEARIHLTYKFGVVQGTIAFINCSLHHDRTVITFSHRKGPWMYVHCRRLCAAPVWVLHKDQVQVLLLLFVISIMCQLTITFSILSVDKLNENQFCPVYSRQVQ